MNCDIKQILEKYLEHFPNERNKLNQLNDLIRNSNSESKLFDSKNDVGHITASGYIYAKKDNKLLLLEHRKLNKLLQPGGHVEMQDKNTLETAIREIKEETGLTNLEQISIDFDKRIPFDINTHFIPEDVKKNMPCHYHHDFRYLFIVDTIKSIDINERESKEYKWVDVYDLCNNIIFKEVIKKMNKLLDNEFKETLFYADIIRNFDVNLQNYECIIVTHLVNGSEPFIDALNSVCNIKAIIPKPNSINKNILKNIEEKYNVIHIKRDEIENNVELNEMIAKSQKDIILFDIGGYFSKIISKKEISKKVRCIIEDTENGHQRYEQENNGKTISVARSVLKDNEDYLVGQSVLFSADHILRNMRKLITYMNCSVLGYGKIGSSIANHLLQRGVKPNVYDKNEIKLIEALNRMCNIETKEEIIKNSDVIFLATGNHCLNINDFRRIKNGCFIFSVTSSDDEIDDTYLQSEYTITEVTKHVFKYENEYNFFYLIEKGNAVNFIHDAVMGEFLSLVKSEMLVAANMYVNNIDKFDDISGILETNKETKMLISKYWLKAYRDFKDNN